MQSPIIPLPATPARVADDDLGLRRPERPRMLVVEDDRELEPLVRRTLTALETPVDIDWCCATSLAYGYLAREFYDLVLVDYLLEGSRAGITLRSACWELQPQAVFAMTSSYPLPEYLRSVGRPGTPFLPKPFGTRELRTFVLSLLEESGSPPFQGARA